MRKKTSLLLSSKFDRKSNTYYFFVESCIGSTIDTFYNRYHAKWCKICARANVKYKQTAIKYTSPDTQHPVPIKFVSVESSENMEVIKQFGIKRFPFIQIYRNMECVASFGTGPAYNFKKVVESTVDEKLNTPVSEWDAFRNEFKNEISQGLQNLDFLRLQADQAAVDEECDISVTSDCVSP